jgi:hypothetical protein
MWLIRRRSSKGCRQRIKGKHKPMSLDILKSYAAALKNLINEIDSKS